MGYTPDNNPYMPGDPYGYDLKWMVEEIKKQRAPEEEAAAAAASAAEAKTYAENASVSANNALSYETSASNSAAQALQSANHANQDANVARQYADNIADPVSGIVTDWLQDNITISPGVVIDTSLSTAGAAADAKATGDAITGVKETLFSYSNMINIATWERGTLDTAGSDTFTVGFFRTKKIPVLPASAIDITVAGNAVFIFEYKADGTFTQTDGVYGGMRYTTDATHTLQDDTYYVRIVLRREPIDTSINLIDITTGCAAVGDIIIPLYNGIIPDTNKAIVNNHFRQISYSDMPFYDAYLNSTTGVSVYNATYRTTDYIDVRGITRLFLTMPKLTNLATNAGIAFYDSSKTYISGVICHEDPLAGWELREIEVPSGAYYARTCFRYSEISDFNMYVDDAKSALTAIDDAALDTSEMLTPVKYNLGIFNKIGVIGDSISVGWALNKNNNPSNRNTIISWPQILARKFGFTAYNMGSSGITPSSWFTIADGYCYDQYLSAGECDAYIIGLGLNPMTMGTVADINSGNYNLNANTFYGQYAKIIQMINAEHPNAKVFCLTEPTPQASAADTAVRTICALNFIDAELVDLEVDYYDIFNTAEIIAQKQPDGIHYTPLGYAYLAEAMAYALNNYIATNPNNFKYVGII